MKDLNFFENYIEKSELNIDKRLILYFFYYDTGYNLYFIPYLIRLKLDSFQGM